MSSMCLILFKMIFLCIIIYCLLNKKKQLMKNMFSFKMSSIPNRFNSYHDEIYYNNHGFAPQFRNHNSKMIRSMFTTDHMNHGDLFSLSSSFSCYQNSSSSSFGLSNSQRTYQMKRNTSSVSHAHSFPLKDNPHFPQSVFYSNNYK